jgi:PleD family two-component response regulator
MPQSLLNACALISIGVVTYDASMGNITKHNIMSAVDKALYASKKRGRNKVSVAVLQAGN